MEITNKLPEDFKKKWVAALRSGEYKQGKGTLYRENNDTHCCLGVACRIAGMENDTIAALDYIPIRYNIPDFLIGEEEIPLTLSSMNDEKVLPFTEIADWIEKHL